MTDYEKRLLTCFPNSFINAHGEFIAHKESNTYFILHNCANETEVKCKVLEWLSRAAFKTLPFYSKKKNSEFHKFISQCANIYLGTNFGEAERELIYTYLGNNINRALAKKFVESGYDLEILYCRQQNPAHVQI